MRETCARVLAAALMTGAIATALGLPAAFDGAEDGVHGLNAPPSSLQRTVRVPAVIARERPVRAERLAAAHPSRPAAAAPRLARQLQHHPAVRHPPSTPHPAAQPETPATPQPETRELTSTTPVVAQPAPSTPPKSDDGRGKKGKSHGKPKGKAKGHEPEAPAAAAPAPSTGDSAAPPGQSEGDQDAHEQGHGHDKDKDKDKGHGHDKED
jgi:hypothetical protein